MSFHRLGPRLYSAQGIFLLSNDADGDGSVLGNGADYEETDYTDPVYPTDFKVEVSGLDGTKAHVHIAMAKIANLIHQFAHGRPVPIVPTKVQILKSEIQGIWQIVLGIMFLGWVIIIQWLQK